MTAPTIRRPITTRTEFHEALRSAFAEAAIAGALEIWLCDASFTDWPLSDPGVVASLSAWAQSRRRLTVYARTFHEIARRHGRWTEWRRLWSHVVDCRSNGELEASEFPTICLVPEVVSLRLFDPAHYRGMASREPADSLACREAIDVVSQRSTEAFPVTTLGL